MQVAAGQGHPAPAPAPGPLPAMLDAGTDVQLADLAAPVRIQGRILPPIVLVHGAVQGGWCWEYSQPDMGAPTGVKGLLEAGGYVVYNPTLPFHDPRSPWTQADGNMSASTYVQAVAQVRLPAGAEYQFKRTAWTTSDTP